MAEWKVYEHRWVGLFSLAGMRRLTRTLLRFHPDVGEVRSIDQERSVEWSAGIASFSGSVSWGRGQLDRTWRKATFGRKPGGGFGLVDEVRFSTRQVKEPIQHTVTAAGWTWRGVSSWRRL